MERGKGMQTECRRSTEYTKDEILRQLTLEGEWMEELFAQARSVRQDTIGDGIFLRGLIEYSNVCRKNCLYCGIRLDCENPDRYTLTHQQVMQAVRYSIEQDYGSVVIQGGENTSEEHISAVEKILRDIAETSGGNVGVTISFGEQSAETYKRWFEAGAHRYLLRIETSNPGLYRRIHPYDRNHDFETRLRALHDLRETGYMVGTGVMIGIPGQTIEDLADDLIFMRELDIDMCGMGPYVESAGTPIAEKGWNKLNAEWFPEDYTGNLRGYQLTLGEPRNRMLLTFKMIASLRLLMPDINIAAATALEALDPGGRTLAIDAGANVVMLNVTPTELRKNYSLYDNKPFTPASLPFVERLRFGQQGNPLRFSKRGIKKYK